MKNNILTHYVELCKEIDDLKKRIDTLEFLGVRVGEILRPLFLTYRELYKKLIAEQIRIERMMDKLEPLERRLIRYKYFDRLTWDGVALKINYSRAQAQRIHTSIIKKLNNVEKS